jgi:hypothetical protein
MADIPFIVVPLALGTIATGNERANRPAAHLGETLYKGMVWQSNGNGDLWVRGDFGAAQAIDFVAVMGANALPGTTIRIRLGDSQAEVDGSADYDSTALPFIDPAVTRADGVYHSHHELPSTVTKRWWRIDIGGHTGDFSASVLVIGLKRQPARYYETMWKTAIRDLGSVTFSRNAVPGLVTGLKLRTLQYSLRWISEAECETMFAPLDELLGRTTPFYLCFDPADTTYRQRRTFFGFHEEAPEITKVRFDGFERTFNILSLW